ncbi:MAG: HD domain-containing protein [Roseburia sp.]|nr:HD domain-containing protein [Roseburia sp.]MCM1099384.1 HD domain-containing protein [Ruminococcus flavefaciens]
MEIRTFLNFLGVAEKLKCNTRHSYTSSGRHESVAEHSWRLALMAYLVKDELPGVDIDRVIRMCLFHDMGEAVTGDIPAFEKTERDEDVEQTAVSEILKRLPEPYCMELGELFREMEALRTPEARLYKALDKLEALIQHNEADLSTWLPLEHELQMIYGTEECGFNEYIKKLRDTVREDSRRKIGKEYKEIPGGQEGA